MAQTKKYSADKFIVDGGTSSGFLKADGSVDTTAYGTGTSNFSGAYADLTGKPTIPSATSELTNDSGFISSTAGNWSGTFDGQEGTYYLAYGNLTGVPSTFAPSAHTLDSHSNVTITSNSSGEVLKWNGSAWVNNTLAEAGIASSASIPTATSDLTNDSGFITDGNTNWNNSYGFITASSTDTLTNKSGNISQWTNDSGYINSTSGNWTGTFDGQEGSYYLNYDNLSNTPTIPSGNQIIDWTAASQGTIDITNLPATALTSVQIAANQTAMLALTTQEGDVVVRSDENKTYMHNGGTAGTMADFTELQSPTDAVTSVNGQTGAVVLTIPTATSDLTNDSGFITDGNTNWNNSYGFITASSTDTLTNKSGNISQWTNDSGYTTFDGAYSSLTGIPSTFAPSSHTLQSHSNVTISSVASGEVLKYNGSAWVNNTLAEAGIASVASIPTATSDLTNDSGFISSTAGNWTGTFDGQEGSYYLAYGNLTGVPSTFAPSAHTLDSHSNVTITSNSSGEILKWNGSAWVNNTLAEAGIASTASIPTATSDLTNDSGFITDGNTNWNNSYGFITASSTETLTNKSGNVSMFTNDAGYISSVTGNWTGTFDGQEGSYYLDYNNFTNTPSLFDGAYSSLTGIPSTFAPSAHTLDSHSNVTITSNSSGEILKWNGSAWINNTLAEAGIASTASIPTATSDLTNDSGFISSTAGNWTGTFDGQEGTYYLAYGNLTGVPSTFAPSAHTLDSHSNVTITSNSSGEILKWNGSAWVNNTLAEAGIASTASIPTATSDLTNDSGFITASSTNTLTNKSGNISQWTNDSGYISSVTGNWTGTFDGQEGSYYLDYNNFTNTPSLFDGAYSSLTGIPSTFAPSAHTLDSHSNVTITSNSSGEILKWNGSAWINNTLAEAGIASTASIPTATSDLTNDSGFISSTSGNWTGTFDGQEGTYYLAYGNLTGVPSTFAPSAHTLDSHSNVTITSNSSGEILKWNGSAWINNTLAEAGIASTASIPTATSDLTNDSGFITDGNTNWNNSYGFITASSTDTLTNKSGNISQWTNDSGYTTFDGAFSSLTGVPTASDSVQGIVELATTAEATAGTDSSRAVTAAGVKKFADDRRYTGSIGDGSSTTLTVTHNLNTTKVQVSFQDASSGAQYLVETNNYGANSFDAVFVTAPTSGAILVTVAKMAG